MDNKSFKLYNIVLGWITFIIAAITYLLTIEPTTSFWDCGEFIATAFKLEVGHPPGAPFFMILGRFFSLFASDPSNVAFMINMMSGLASAFTILFLFWTISHIAKKVIVKNGKIEIWQSVAIFGSALTGALAYTFSDSFWFSAVEAEVYSTSSLFTAIVFWAILKWENVSDKPYSNRWIILISYLVGLSIGVHLLNLLAIPAIVFVVYFKKYKPTTTGVVYASLVSLGLLGATMYFIIPYTVKLAGGFELFFVNTLGMPYNSGVFIYITLLVGLIIFGLWYTHKKKKVILNTILLSITVILIGYSSFSMIVIRSIANPPMDENNPEDLFKLLSYLNREQYGDSPLIYGEYYNAPAAGMEYTKGTWIKKDGKYVKSNVREINTWDDKFKTFFPRMYSRQESHIREYKKWVDIKGRPIKVRARDGNTETLYKPTFGENLTFFFKYQLGHMYFRYFMWNFAGKQNDTQGHGGVLHGNWISGISFIDSMRLGNQDEITDLAKEEKSRNTYFLLPFILGIVGLLYLMRKHIPYFWIVMLLFVFTGIAIVVWLNQYPLQPRERDYSYAASFYAYSIWIGIGVLGLIEGLKKFLNKNLAAPIAGIAALILVPGIMAAENWDDHDRSGRYTALEIARNYLESCEKDGILFTFGDNDTFPLWYAQEVEGIRTDVRVVNMSLLSMDWYIEQMRRKAYDSDPVPFTISPDKYIQGTRDQIFVIEEIKEYTELEKLINFVVSDNEKTKKRVSRNTAYDYMPVKNVKITIDKNRIINTGTVSGADTSLIVSEMKWRIPKSSLIKSELMMLDFLIANNWERPVYFASSAGTASYLNLEKYFQLEGFVYRLVPIEKTDNNDDRQNVGRINTEILYKNIVENYNYGRMNEDDVFIGEHNKRVMMILKVRTIYSRLAIELVNEGKIDSAKTTLDRLMEIMPHKQFPFDHSVIPVIQAYYLVNEDSTANKYSEQLAELYFDELDYYNSLNSKEFSVLRREKQIAQQIISMLADMARRYKQDELQNKLITRLAEYK